MLTDTLQTIHDTEEQAEKIITDAHVKVRDIEKRTYQQITKIENTVNSEIAIAISELPQPKPLPDPVVNLEVPQTKVDTAVDYIIKAVYGA